MHFFWIRRPFACDTRFTAKKFVASSSFLERLLIPLVLQGEGVNCEEARSTFVIRHDGWAQPIDVCTHHASFSHLMSVDAGAGVCTQHI